jgi:hypothetical protein
MGRGVSDVDPATLELRARVHYEHMRQYADSVRVFSVTSSTTPAVGDESPRFFYGLSQARNEPYGQNGYTLEQVTLLFDASFKFVAVRETVRSENGSVADMDSLDEPVSY